MTQQRYPATDLFEKNELYQTFQKLIEERDSVIKQLVGRLQQAQQAQLIPSHTTISSKKNISVQNIAPVSSKFADSMADIPNRPRNAPQVISSEQDDDDQSARKLVNEAERMNTAMSRIRDQ